MSSHGANAYYPWYVRDFRSSRKVQRMGYIARGFYRELLDEEFLEGSLPSDLESLADICGCPIKVMERAWKELEPCFQEINGRLFNTKLEQIRTEKDQVRVKRADSGRLGGIAKHSLANASKCHIAEQSKAEKSSTLANASPLPSQPLLPDHEDKLQSSLDAFVSAWNENRGDLSQVIELGDDRRKKLQTRIRSGLTIERFIEAVKECANTPFLAGSNDRKWRAGFDWLIGNDSNLLKVLEGKYADSTAPRPPAATVPGGPQPSPLLPHRDRVISLDSIRAKAGIQ